MHAAAHKAITDGSWSRKKHHRYGLFGTTIDVMMVLMLLVVMHPQQQHAVQAFLGSSLSPALIQTLRRKTNRQPPHDNCSTRNFPSPTAAATSTTMSTTKYVHDSSIPPTEKDSLSALERDVTTVLKKLRADATDPTLQRPFDRSSERGRRLPSFTKLWTLDDWNRHTSRWRYVDYLRTFPSSRLLGRIAPHLLLLGAWSVAAVWGLDQGPRLWPSVFSKINFSWNLTPLSLVSSFVFALETLRSNQGLSRLNDGRLAFAKVVHYTRDMAQLSAAAVYPKDPQLGLKLARHISLFAWLLKKQLRGQDVNGTDDDIVRCLLVDPADADFVLRHRKAPLAIVTRVRQVIVHMAEHGQLSTAEEIAMDHAAQELNHCVASTERIVSSPIPVLYTGHLGRLLLFYLLLLPLALRGSNILGSVGTVVTTLSVGFATLGLDEISHILEQPFKYMPLWQLSKRSMADVADAFVCQPPPLVVEDSDSDAPPSPWQTPTYW